MSRSRRSSAASSEIPTGLASTEFARTLVFGNATCCRKRLESTGAGSPRAIHRRRVVAV